MSSVRQMIQTVSRYRQDVAVVAIGLAVFLALLTVLAHFMFPEGQRLGAAAGGGDDAGALRQAGRRLGFDARTTPDGPALARLTRIVRHVEQRGGSDVAWARAHGEASLADRDAVQTRARSRAYIRFAKGGVLRLDENSQVVIRAGQTDPFAGRMRPSVVMVHGTLTGGLENHDGAGGLDVQTPAGLVSLSPKGASDETFEFRLAVDQNDGTRLSLVGGAGQIDVNGRLTAIGINEALTIDANGQITRQRLPPAPTPILPANNASFRFGGTAPLVRFRWSGPSSTAYRLTLARDEVFDDIVVDVRIDRPLYQTAGLKPGRYFWRVSAIVDGHEGPASGGRAMQLVRDQAPPPLVLDPVPARVAGNSVTIRGSSASGTTVFVRGEPVLPNPDGRFEHRLQLSPGTHVVVIEAVDNLGNVAFASASVTSKPTSTNE